MASPKSAAGILSITRLRKALNYGDPKLLRCQTFIDDFRGFRGKFVTDDGVSGPSFHQWKSHLHHRGLDEMTDAYLDEQGNGSLFWPDDKASIYYNSLQYSKNRGRIASLVKQLFFRLNLQQFRNNKYKQKRRAGRVMNMSRAGSSTDPIDLGAVDEDEDSQDNDDIDDDDDGHGITSADDAVDIKFCPSASSQQYTYYTFRAGPTSANNPNDVTSKQSTTISNAVKTEDKDPYAVSRSPSPSFRQSQSRFRVEEPQAKRPKTHHTPQATSPSLSKTRAILSETSDVKRSPRDRRKLHRPDAATDEQLDEAMRSPSCQSDGEAETDTEAEREPSQAAHPRKSAQGDATGTKFPSQGVLFSAIKVVRRPGGSSALGKPVAKPLRPKERAPLAQMERSALGNFDVAHCLNPDLRLSHPLESTPPPATEKNTEDSSAVETAEDAAPEPLPLASDSTEIIHPAQKSTASPTPKLPSPQPPAPELCAPKQPALETSTPKQPALETSTPKQPTPEPPPKQLVTDQQTTPTQPAKAPPKIEFSYQIVLSRVPLFECINWAPNGRFLDKTLSQLEKEMPLAPDPDAKGLVFTLGSRKLRIRQEVLHGQHNIFDMMKSRFEVAIRECIPQLMDEGQPLLFVMQIEALKDKLDGVGKERYSGEVEF